VYDVKMIVMTVGVRHT